MCRYSYKIFICGPKEYHELVDDVFTRILRERQLVSFLIIQISPSLDVVYEALV